MTQLQAKQAAINKREKQDSTFIDRVEHQRHAAAPDNTAIGHQYQPVQGEMSQQD